MFVCSLCQSRSSGDKCKGTKDLDKACAFWNKQDLIDSTDPPEATCTEKDPVLKMRYEKVASL